MEATQTPTKPATLFESEMCSRCGGSGRHSRCAMYGTTCFRCSGRGITLTKRGALAQEYYRKLCCLPAQEITPGMRLRIDSIDGMTGLLRTVTFSGYKPEGTGGWRQPDGSLQPYYYLEAGGYVLGTSPTALYRVAQTKETQARKQAEALAYQASLTKAGKPVSVKA